MHAIPLIDIRQSTPATLACQQHEKVRNLINASRDSFGIASRLASYVAFPVGDILSRHWIDKTSTPYADEIHTIAKELSTRGIYALNLCYEWGCTSGVFATNDSATLVRILDWPFPALGENMVVTHQKGSGGEFYNITWPGITGVFTALSPGKFAAALNQAPMRRHLTGVAMDWLRNRVRLQRQNALPPAHLLRKVFETATNYDEAKHMLCNTPVALPVIYILSGMNIQEGCVIERLEESYHVRELVPHDRVYAANHFESHFNGIGHGWLPRAIASNERAHCMRNISSTTISGKNFEWFVPPIANDFSRLACVMDAKNNSLNLIGTHGTNRITHTFSL